ncbi:hypothetical protein FH972_005541 [Carpinus fangiana]|uniref:Uncharacterized protein n=1 Tax=Carpinus fangiana TaxID=176857 RepID=A0A5N6QPK9_9ROSI|nr:hypothetical protein FH972_005541 [Carpinus fangiana]
MANDPLVGMFQGVRIGGHEEVRFRTVRELYVGTEEEEDVRPFINCLRPWSPGDECMLHVPFVPHRVKITPVGAMLGALNLKMVLEHIASFYWIDDLINDRTCAMLSELKKKNKLLEDQLRHKEAVESRLYFVLIALCGLCLTLSSMLKLVCNITNTQKNKQSTERRKEPKHQPINMNTAKLVHTLKEMEELEEPLFINVLKTPTTLKSKSPQMPNKQTFFISCAEAYNTFKEERSKGKTNFIMGLDLKSVWSRVKKIT